MHGEEKGQDVDGLQQGATGGTGSYSGSVSFCSQQWRNTGSMTMGITSALLGLLPLKARQAPQCGVTHKTNMGQHYNLHKMVREDICEGWI